MLEFLNSIFEALNKQNLKFQFYEFDSGAVIIDFWLDDVLYCIQMADKKFGWTKIDENIDFCSIPDSGYLEWNEFKPQFEQIIKIRL